MLDTVGGAFERLGHSASPAVLAALWAVVLAKTIAAGLPVVVNRGLARPSLRGALRRLAWLAGWGLAAYGLVLAVPGLAIQAGLLHVGARADRRALPWHAYLWDPWFLVWGLLGSAGAGESSRSPGRGHISSVGEAVSIAIPRTLPTRVRSASWASNVAWFRRVTGRHPRPARYQLTFHPASEADLAALDAALDAANTKPSSTTSPTGGSPAKSSEPATSAAT